MTAKTAPWQGLHSPGAHHAVAWLYGDLGADLTGSEVLTLAVITNLADVDLAPGAEPGYLGHTTNTVSIAMRVPHGVVQRRLDRLVEVGALVKRPWILGTHRYWLPDEVNLP